METVSLEMTLYQFAGISINYESNNTVTVLMASGITAEIKILSRMLHIILSVPTSLKGQVRGLVGNWDDDTSNDFMLPNGTWIPINSSRTDIHYLFGMAWSTTNKTSLFTYPQGLTWLTTRICHLSLRLSIPNLIQRVAMTLHVPMTS
jgi:hypothetical protein